MMKQAAANKVDPQRAVVSGLSAGSAYLGAMWLDNKLSSHPFNDIKLVGQMFTTKSPWWIMQGLAGHFSFSVVMALLYSRYFYSWLPGPGILKGIIFLNIENTVLYPGALISDRIHMAVRNGELAPLLNRKSFMGQVVRHMAFGATLGLLYRPRA